MRKPLSLCAKPLVRPLASATGRPPGCVALAPRPSIPDRVAAVLKKGLLGRQIGCGGGHVSGAPVQGVRMVRLCCPRVRVRSRCRVPKGIDALRRSGDQAVLGIPYITWPKAQAFEQTSAPEHGGRPNGDIAFEMLAGPSCLGPAERRG